MRFGDPLVAGDKVAVEWWTTMRDEDAEETVPGCLLLRFAADGRCEELREYTPSPAATSRPTAGDSRPSEP